MKNIVILIGVLSVLVNTLTGFIFTNYPSNNVFFADLSIILTTGVLYATNQMNFSDGFKIGFTLLFIALGIIRLLLSLVSPNQIADNFAFIVFVFLVALEWIIVYVGYIMRDK